MTASIHTRRHRLAERDGGWFCHWCKTELVCHICEPDRATDKTLATLEHVVRLADGGGILGTANHVLACKPCNSSRHDLPKADRIERQEAERAAARRAVKAERRRQAVQQNSHDPTSKYPVVWDPVLKTFVVDRPGRFAIYDSARPGTTGWVTPDGQIRWERKQTS